MIPVCLALTLHWAETGPLLRWAQAPLLCPYFALGLDFATLMRIPGSPTLALSLRVATLSTLQRALLVHAAHLGREARALPPSLRGASYRASSPCRP